MCMSASEKPDRLDGRSDLLAGALSNNASDEEPEWLADAGPTEHHNGSTYGARVCPRAGDPCFLVFFCLSLSALIARFL